LGIIYSLYVSKNANKSKADFDGLVAEVMSFMFPTTKGLQNRVLSIYRTQITVIQSKNIRITGVDPADHEIL
jgi:hypothetical protein